jgi:hypothetical protein
VTRLLAALMSDDRTAPHSRRRVVIGRTREGLPRTYRLVRPRTWPVRLAAALIGLSGLG